MEYEKTREVIGPEGELIEQESTIVKKITAEHYCQLYIRDNSELFRLSQSEYRILSACIAMSVYFDDEAICPGNMITMNAVLRKYIKDRCLLCDSAIDHGMSTLVRKGMLFKMSGKRGVYYLNPKHFFKGKATSRIKCVKKVELWVSDPEFYEKRIHEFMNDKKNNYEERSNIS